VFVAAALGYTIPFAVLTGRMHGRCQQPKENTPSLYGRGSADDEEEPHEAGVSTSKFVGQVSRRLRDPRASKENPGRYSKLGRPHTNLTDIKRETTNQKLPNRTRTTRKRYCRSAGKLPVLPGQIRRPLPHFCLSSQALSNFATRFKRHSKLKLLLIATRLAPRLRLE